MSNNQPFDIQREDSTSGNIHHDQSEQSADALEGSNAYVREFYLEIHVKAKADALFHVFVPDAIVTTCQIKNLTETSCCSPCIQYTRENERINSSIIFTKQESDEEEQIPNGNDQMENGFTLKLGKSLKQMVEPTPQFSLPIFLSKLQLFSNDKVKTLLLPAGINTVSNSPHNPAVKICSPKCDVQHVGQESMPVRVDSEDQNNGEKAGDIISTTEVVQLPYSQPGSQDNNTVLAILDNAQEQGRQADNAVLGILDNIQGEMSGTVSTESEESPSNVEKTPEVDATDDAQLDVTDSTIVGTRGDAVGPDLNTSGSVTKRTRKRTQFWGTLLSRDSSPESDHCDDNWEPETSSDSSSESTYSSEHYTSPDPSSDSDVDVYTGKRKRRNMAKKRKTSYGSHGIFFKQLGKQSFKCFLCGKRFDNMIASEKRQHILQVHGNEWVDFRECVNLYNQYLNTNRNNESAVQSRNITFGKKSELNLVMDTTTPIDNNDISVDMATTAANLDVSPLDEATPPCDVKATPSCDVEATMSCDVEATVSCDVEATLSCHVEPTVSCDVEATLSCDVEPTPSCDVEPTVSCDVEPTPSCDVEPTVSCDVEATMSCDVEATLSCEVEPTVSCDVEATPSCDVEPTMSCDVEPTMSCDVEATPSCDVEAMSCDVEATMSCVVEATSSCDVEANPSCDVDNTMSCDVEATMACDVDVSTVDENTKENDVDINKSKPNESTSDNEGGMSEETLATKTLKFCLLCNKENRNLNFGSASHHWTEFHNSFVLENNRQTNFIVEHSVYRFIDEGTVTINNGTGIYRCIQCSTDHTTHENMLLHLQECHDSASDASLPKGKYQCTICYESFPQYGALKVHMMEIHRSKSVYVWPCQKCDRHLPSKKHLLIHLADVHHDGFPCPVKNCTTYHNYKLADFKRHLILCHMIKRKEPTEGFNDSKTDTECMSTGVNHVNSGISIKKQFRVDLCIVCGEIMNRRNGYKFYRHIEKRHQAEIKVGMDFGGIVISDIFECTECDLKFTTQKRKESHNANKHADQTCPCPGCNKSFPGQESLNSHLNCVHWREKMNCKICGKEFWSTANRNKHVQSVHGNRRDHQCVICKQIFKRADHLKIHFRKHTGEKPHKCEYCDFAGRQRNNILSHMKVHHKDKL